MRKQLFRAIVLALTGLVLLPFQTVEACTGFIIGKDLTVDGSTLYGRTEDLEPNHNKNFVVRERKYNKAGATFVDQATGCPAGGQLQIYSHSGCHAGKGRF